MLKRRNKKLIAVMAAVLAVVMVISASFAWFTASDYVKNEFKTGILGDGSVTVFEIFDKEKAKEWYPGTEIDKMVAAYNSGDMNVLVRVSFEEMLSRLTDSERKYANVNFNDSTMANNILAPYTAPTSSLTWTNVEASMFGTDATAYTASGLVVKYTAQEIKKSDGTSYTPAQYVYQFTGYYPATAGNQYVRLDDAITADRTLLAGNPVFHFDATKVKYGYYSGVTKNEIYWSSTATAAKYLTTSAVRNTPTAVVSPYTSAVDSNGYVTFKFANLTATPTASNWYYYKGYFYYMSVLKPNEISPYLLQSVLLSKDADYQMVTYDLYVDLEALQCTAEAVKQAWGLDPTTDATVYNALAALCSD